VTSFIISRFFQALIVIILVSIIVFMMMRLMPGDPVLLYLAKDETARVSPEQMAELRHQFWLDRPIVTQYIHWLDGAVRGDLGYSLSTQRPVMTAISESIQKTVHIGVEAFVLAVIIGVPMGVIAAVKRGTWQDTLVTMMANAGTTIPIFWLGILLIYVFSYYLHVLPVFGYTSPFENFWMSMKQTILPVICVTTIPVAALARQTRSAMLEIVREDYIRTARAKGLSENSIIFKHALRNALIPVVTLAGMMIRQIIGGVVLVEVVFSIPGMGRLAVEGVLSQDYLLVQGVILVISTMVVIANLVVEISYGWIDPRIRYD
jgi:peptide/nickel transport system permease protein